MELVHESLVSRLFQESAWRRQLAVSALPVLPLLAEAAVSFIVCRGYLNKRPRSTAMPISIKSILLINVFLTVLVVCATLAEGVISAAQVMKHLGKSGLTWGGIRAAATYSAATPLSSRWSDQQTAATPLISSSISVSISSWSDQMMAASLQEQEAAADEVVDRVALGLLWMVVAAFVGAVCRVGLRVAGETGCEKGSWSLQALSQIMQLVDRIKWVGFCFALLFYAWGSFFIIVWPKSYLYISDLYADEPRRDVAGHLLALMRQSMNSERVWRWTTASSILILQALVSLYTLAARVALHISCKRFSLADDPFISRV